MIKSHVLYRLSYALPNRVAPPAGGAVPFG